MVQVSPQSHSFHPWVESQHPCVSPRLLAIELPVYRTRAHHLLFAKSSANHIILLSAISPSGDTHLHLSVGRYSAPLCITAQVGFTHLPALLLQYSMDHPHPETTLPRPDHLPNPPPAKCSEIPG